MKLVFLFLCSAAFAQTPQLKARPEISYAPIRDEQPVHRNYHWKRRLFEFGTGALAAKLADDSCDAILGAKKARYVGAAGFAVNVGIQELWWKHHQPKATK